MATLTLRVLNGPEQGSSFTVPPGGATLGRTRVADIHLSDGLLSRLHCRFELTPGPTVQDLGSSNGTLLNGTAIGTAPEVLKEGDLLTVGDTILRVEVQGAEPPIELSKTAVLAPQEQPQATEAQLAQVAPPQSAPEASAAVPEAVDLGLAPKPESPERAKRKPLHAIILALAAILVLVVGVGIVVTTGNPPTQPARPKSLPSAENLPLEFQYERLEINERMLYRSRITYTHDGTLAVDSVDLGEQNRKFSTKKTLNDQAKAALRREILESNYTAIPELFPEQGTNPQTLHRQQLTIVLGTTIWKRTAENTTNDTFARLANRLETFTRNELGIWAAELSVEELTEKGEEQLRLGQRYWDQRDLDDEKLYLALAAYKLGCSYLETLNPKPAFARELNQGRQAAEALLTERYEAVIFSIDQALNTQRYADAATALRKILRMIPDREDERNRQATDKLLQIENRYLKKGAH
ncbi:MAG: FHA domain-containing protein [Candidatus Spyradenecus sp.]